MAGCVCDVSGSAGIPVPAPENLFLAFALGCNSEKLRHPSYTFSSTENIIVIKQLSTGFVTFECVCVCSQSLLPWTDCIFGEGVAICKIPFLTRGSIKSLCIPQRIKVYFQ